MAQFSTGKLTLTTRLFLKGLPPHFTVTHPFLTSQADSDMAAKLRQDSCEANSEALLAEIGGIDNLRQYAIGVFGRDNDASIGKTQSLAVIAVGSNLAN